MELFIRFKDFCYYNRKIIILSFFCLIVVLFFYFEFSYETTSGVSENIILENDLEKEIVEEVTNNNFVIVDIKGAVVNPGTYEMKEDDRVIDVIDMALGLLENSDTSTINLSKKVYDEMVIYVPFKDDVLENDIINEYVYENSKSETDYSNVSNNVVTDGKISINNASLSDLMKIKGIGEVKALSIIEYRNSNGNFKSIEDIKNVSGIGNKTFEKIKEYIKL